MPDKNDWFYPIPIYATRKYGLQGTQGQLTAPAVLLLPILWLILANLILWGIVGIVAAVGVLV